MVANAAFGVPAGLARAFEKMRSAISARGTHDYHALLIEQRLLPVAMPVLYHFPTEIIFMGAPR